MAAMLSKHFVDNQLIVCAYATDIEKWVSSTGQASLTSALEYYGVKYPDALQLLRSEGEAKETHWFFSVDDAKANLGNENLTAKQLTTYACEENHGNLLRGRWDQIREIISQRPQS